MILSMENKYIIRSQISEKKFREILWHFLSDIEVIKISEFTKISEVSLCKIFKRIRILIATKCEALKSNERSEVEFRYNN